MSNILEIENLSKQYRLGTVGTGTLGHDLNRWWHRVRGKDDPYLKIGETNDRSIKGNSEYVWALKDINLTINEGEVLGIIGKNGAGKSTLLKILSKVTGPTTGTVKAYGRIASLLEVGTGFHPELSGRENIYLNGAILGMRKHEITRKFDEIVDFAGVERYIDTPVKRYSSGMYVRLAFAVAAHLEPEILVVDEVLAVGDADFQKKAIGKMKDVSKGEGRTVLFVSHNMGSINSLCKNSVWLENGRVKEIGESSLIINNYLKNYGEAKSTSVNWNNENRPQDSFAALNSIRLIDSDMNLKELFSVDDNFGIEICYELKKETKGGANFLLSTQDGTKVFQSLENSSEIFTPGIYKSICWFPKNLLNDDNYMITAAITTHNPTQIHCSYNLFFDVVDSKSSILRGNYMGKMHGVIRPALKWETKRI